MAEFKNYKEVAFLLSKCCPGAVDRKGGGKRLESGDRNFRRMNYCIVRF